MNGSVLGNKQMVANSSTIKISDYEQAVRDTDIINQDELNPILQGLFGEVGGIMSTAKKVTRDKEAFPGSTKAAEEEFGDTLWYLAALCRRLKYPLEDIFNDATGSAMPQKVGVASDFSEGAFGQIFILPASQSIDKTMFELGHAAAALLTDSPSRDQIVNFAKHYLVSLNAANMTFSNVVRSNIKKTRGAYVEPDTSELPDFDKEYQEEERLPTKFRIRVSQRNGGKCYLQWQGVFIGDPLTDNIADADGYRFHDIFHFSYAAILHWSPVMRALIKHKRKSNPKCDESQDGGRAIVVEEGLTAWIFSRAKELNFFEGQERVSLGMLKTIEEFVAGYEVARCPLKLWEKAILQGYDVFRAIQSSKGGWIIGDRENRTLKYEPLEDEK